MKKRSSNSLFLAIVALFVFLIPMRVFSKEPVVVGSKSFTESVLLGEMMALLLEEKFNQPVTRRLALGGTKIAFDGLNAGAVDVYPDYTGTGYSMILKLSAKKEPSAIFKTVSREFKKQWGIVWSKPIGFNNTYALAVRRDDKRFAEVSRVSELSEKVEAYKYAGAYEFMERKDGHHGFVEAYSLNFNLKNVVSMQAGLMYAAIKDKQVDMIVSYSTDGRIKAYGLKLLEDDLKFFPSYQASFLAKENILDEKPAIKKVFKLMEGLITSEEMVEMNDQVDRFRAEPSLVAKNFLIKKGLLEGNMKDSPKDESFFTFALRKKQYLLKILKEHLILSFVALFLAVLVSLPLGVLLTRYERLSKLVFPIVNTIQTIPSLALLGFLIPFMGIGMTPAVLALFLYSLLPLVRNTYVGISDVDENYIEASKGIGLTNMQILFKVEIPLALPVIMAGLRTAAVIVIGTATLAALIGAGGFGDPIFRGVSTVNSNLILLGAVPAALLAVLTDKLFGLSERILISKGISQQNKK